MSVHPHVRGDNYAVKTPKIPILGPPPHTWGQRQVERDGVLIPRSTPTYVGTTSPPPGACLPRAVHPHIRGDNAE